MNAQNTPSKSEIIALLNTWIKQRSGMDYRNYGDSTSYRAEQRSITKDRHDAERLIRAVENTESITAADLMKATRAYSGRLQIVDTGKGWKVEYCTGQYFPTEYRAAVCAVLALALWEDSRRDIPAEIENKGEYLRRSFVSWFGKGIASRWFN